MAAVLALLIVSLLAGVIARRLPAFPAETPKVLNAVILNVALPALVVRVLHGVTLSAELGAAAAALWVQFLLACGLFFALGKALRLSRGTVGALILTGGLSNTAYVGLPVIEMALGRQALGAAVFVDQLGSFLVMATLGMTVAAALSGDRVRPRELLRKVVLFPPFVSLIAALLLRPVAFAPWVTETLERLGALLTPLALFSVGFQLQLSALRARAGALSLGLAFKLVLSPIVIGALLSLVASPASIAWQVAFLQCAMPPMVTGGILAAEHDCDPPLAAAMIGVGIPLSALTLAAAIAWL